MSREEIRVLLDPNIGELREVRSRLKLRKAELIVLYNQRKKKAAELTRFCIQNENKTADTTEPESILTESERPAKRANVVSGLKSSSDAPWTSA